MILWKGCRFAARNNAGCVRENGRETEFIEGSGAAREKWKIFFFFYLRGTKRVVYLHPLWETERQKKQE
ncbi:MAG: hypothetical protein ACKVJF_05580 [Flavobacteriales bacterium]